MLYSSSSLHKVVTLGILKNQIQSNSIMIIRELISSSHPIRSYSSLFSRDLKKLRSTTNNHHQTTTTSTTSKNGPFHHYNSAKTSHHPMHGSYVVALASKAVEDHSVTSSEESSTETVQPISYGHLFARDLIRKKKH
ncbi:hypothetical protein FDP41_002349 [Naegleria fowleri]|uniref:Uncharacterized protein n=1 Tax=Naegleria fowleri TaxID=5763 RepID=A0A6A5BZU3_NAEFO|nr:uncharacterized protein FDP41_002349 [Naegleria fowleri]KAF0978529.1 hypothetical protein FDP41_002349 [Naegleria fowleri]CAG4709213.1 unnamed protein product [Naegleria fowleri]